MQLSNLLTWMDGRAGAEDLLAKMLQDGALLKALAAAPKPESPSTESNKEQSNG